MLNYENINLYRLDTMRTKRTFCLYKNVKSYLLSEKYYPFHLTNLGQQEN